MSADLEAAISRLRRDKSRAAVRRETRPSESPIHLSHRHGLR